MYVSYSHFLTQFLHILLFCSFSSIPLTRSLFTHFSLNALTFLPLSHPSLEKILPSFSLFLSPLSSLCDICWIYFHLSYQIRFPLYSHDNYFAIYSVGRGSGVCKRHFLILWKNIFFFFLSSFLIQCLLLNWMQIHQRDEIHFKRRKKKERRKQRYAFLSTHFLFICFSKKHFTLFSKRYTSLYCNWWVVIK